MKKIYKISMLAGLLGLVGGGLAGVHAYRGNVKQAKADEITKYIPIDDNFRFQTNNFGVERVSQLVSNRNDRFHDNRRPYDTMDNFLNTMSMVSEDKTGGICSTAWINKGGYISFLLGGNASNFVNVWDNTAKKDLIQIKHDFYASHNDWGPYSEGTQSDYELTANTALKFYEVPAEALNHELYLYIEDNTINNYGGIIVSDIRVNQTLDEVVETFVAHKQQIQINGEVSVQAGYSRTYMLNTYYNNDYYAVLRNREALLTFTEADDGFEVYGASNWIYDPVFSTASPNFSTLVSDRATIWGENMPSNPTGNRYINADTSGIDESAKYRLISREFTLSGSGFVSAKLGGGTAVLSVIDSTGAELGTTRLSHGEEENPILNPAFVDNGGVANIVLSGSRLNTMSRVFLDCSQHIGEKVRVVLSDDRTGGNWGLAFIDEVKTYYESAPTKFSLERFVQENGTGKFYGVVRELYSGPSTTNLYKANAFLKSFDSVLRAGGNSNSWCDISKDEAVTNLKNAYGQLESGAKAIVDASADYNHVKDNAPYHGADAYLYDVDLGTYTVANTMTYLSSYVPPANPQPNNSGFRLANMNSQEVAATLIITISVIAVSVLCAFMFIRKRKEQK